MPELSRRIGRNTLVTMGGEVLGRLLGAVYQVMLARHLGALVFGELSFAVALTAILGVVSDLGLVRLVTREVARRVDDPWPVVIRAIAGRAVLALGLGVLGVLFTSAAGRPPAVVSLVAILALSQWIQGAAEILAAAHRGRERMVRPAAVGVLCRLGLTLSGLAAVALQADVLFFAALTVVWTIPAVLLLLPGLPPRSPAPLRPRETASLVRRALPIGLGMILWTISFRIDLVLLGIFRGDEEVGLYAAPFRLVEVALLLSGPLLTAVFPVLARRGDPESARTAFRGAVRILAVVGFPLAAVFTVEAAGILVTLFGPEFEPAAGSLRLLSLTVPLSFLAAPCLTLLLSRDRDRTYAVIMGVGAVVNLAVALPLIPRHGHLGAAVAALATEVAVTAVSLVVAWRAERPPRPVGAIARALAAALGLGGGLLLRSANVAFLPRAALGMMVLYPVLALATGAIRFRDLGLILPDRRGGR